MENEVKEPAPKYNHISPDEYLEMERSSDQKHEYYDGQIFAMSGASKAHNRIAMNLYSMVGSFLNEKSCEMYPADMRVSTPGRNAYIYPDASIVCGETKLEDDKFDTLLNPTVVFEILSPSTRKSDVGYKLLWYQNIPSLREYIMIDSTKRFVQTVRKQPDGDWRIENLTDALASLTIQSISYSISLNAIYRDTGL